MGSLTERREQRALRMPPSLLHYRGQRLISASPHCLPAEGTPSALLPRTRDAYVTLFATQRYWWAAHGGDEQPSTKDNMPLVLRAVVG